MPALPNVREISDSYDEKYPDPNSRFNMKTFGPCVETLTIHLPMPVESTFGMTVDELTRWLHENSPDAMKLKMEWAIVLEQEKKELHMRLVRNVVRQVNAAIQRCEVVALSRNPDTMVFW